MRWALAGMLFIPAVAAAQPLQVQQQPPATQQQPPPQQQQQQPPPQQPSAAWSQLPRMQLERQFAGPLRDTIIQRWRDPADGMICYVYLPITAPHTPPDQSGFVQYGANIIGSISCVAPGGSAPAAQRKTGQRPPQPEPPASR